MSEVEVRRARVRAQLLASREARPVVEVARSLLAVQAQDWRSLRLALRARSSEAGLRALEAALEERSVVVSWLVRGTLHLVAAEDWAWLL
ncbi:MAG TPA: crosslink repair DNA glycosylase YcaQ family protein, partial [Solirubrobacteraceae bacterium]|nr:crosslink repair DNA glycosylase YcaQ family protein [Solirubrobacteraceae bacterium]